MQNILRQFSWFQAPKAENLHKNCCQMLKVYIMQAYKKFCSKYKVQSVIDLSDRINI